MLTRIGPLGTPIWILLQCDQRDVVVVVMEEDGDARLDDCEEGRGRVGSLAPAAGRVR